MSFDTFDTDSVATAGITFSNGSLTALGASGTSLSTSAIAQTLEGKKSGLWYVEFTCVAVSGNVDGVGLVSSLGLGAGFLGDDTNGTGWGAYTNSNIANGTVSVTTVNPFTYTAGDVIGMAIDLNNKFVWFNKNGSLTWCGASGVPNPATTTGGFSLTSGLANSCRVYPCVNLSGSAAKFTINCGASAFTGAVPTGFTSGWTNTTAGTYFGSLATTGNGGSLIPAPPGGDKAVTKWTAMLSGALTSIVMAWLSGGSNFYCVIYADNAGSPGALLAVSAIGATVVGEIAFSFMGVSVTSGTSYWIGMQAANTGAPGIWCPPKTAGIPFNANAGYPTPSNPFGSSSSAANFRYPMLAFVTTSTGETAAVTLALSGVGFNASAGRRETASASLALSKVSFNAGSGRTETANPVALALKAIAYAAQAAVVQVKAAVTMALSGVTIQAGTLDLPPAGEGKRTFWTFGA